MDCIAEQTFTCHPVQGEPFVLTAKFGRPSVEETGGGREPHGACLISFEPLVPERRFAANNQFQAMCLVIEYLRTTLKVFTGEGGRVYWENTDSLVDLNSPWLAPLPGRKQLGGNWWSNLQKVGVDEK